MKEYIERAAVLSALKIARGYCPCAYDEITKMKAADVVEVRHGRWIKRQNPQWKAYYHDACSVCGWWNTKNALCYDGKKKPGHSLNYCPNCGAMMDGGTKP